MAKKPVFAVADEDGDSLVINRVDAEDWERLVVSVTDEDEIPASMYLDVASTAKLHAFLGDYLKGLS